jgi:thiamine biosynthesis lipoprotein
MRAFGCQAVVATTDTPQLPFARRTLVGALRALDLACSRFRDDSELVALNQSAGRPVRVSAMLYGALKAAVTAGRLSGGLVDPTVGRALGRAGYTVSFERLTGLVAVTAAPPTAAGRLGELEIDPDSERRLVRVPAGVELDLGASAKAWLADQVARVVASRGAGALVAIGGDIAVCGPAPADGWPVRIGADHAAPLTTPGPVVAITAGGIASSSTALRRWKTTAGEHHHIIDPRHGLPARTPCKLP